MMKDAVTDGPGRPTTAFQQFIKNKRDGIQTPPQGATLQFGPVEPVFIHTVPHPDIISPASTVGHVGIGQTGLLHQGKRSRTPNVQAPSTPPAVHTMPGQLDLGELAAAASSLAVAAKALATAPRIDSRFSKSYQNLASAAAELAQDAARSAAQSPSHHPFTAAAALPPSKAPESGAGSRRQGPAPVTADGGSTMLPFQAHLSGSSFKGPVTPVKSGLPPHRPFVNAPKFPPYNPLIHLRTSELAPPGTPGAGRQLSRGGGTPGSSAGLRPSTSNPITHEIHTFEGPMLGGGRPGSRLGSGAGGRGRAYGTSADSPWSEGPAEGAGGGGGAASGRAGDRGSRRAQVLVVDQHLAGGAAASSNGCSVRINGSGAEVSPMEFILDHPERVRLEKWPPSSPFHEDDVDVDNLALRYNDAVNRIREKILLKELPLVMLTFKKVDPGQSGWLDRGSFRSLLKTLDFGVGDMEDKVIDLVLDDVGGYGAPQINYTDFVGKMRHNKVPLATYNAKLRHRTLGNVEQPFGASTMSAPWGTSEDQVGNEMALNQLMEGEIDEFRRAFQRVDDDQDGAVTYEQFMAALKSVGQSRDLKYSDYYLQCLFREADKSFTRKVNYEELLSSNPGPPEFSKPKMLRSSQLAPPWEWKPNGVVQQILDMNLHRGPLPHSTAAGALLASSVNTLQRLGTAQAAVGRATQFLRT
ncbi:hypothetical protein CEUSTIGMA_g6151.t1 [Chlamydomonas eustigma]|uniref:EF-hand domain-containing protein n=1 Tax=Chlamydomonas eustigma TaxID=1157962 RepID=A0A250X6K5_9CHLO|nr:hypothetical protein CEUSTIGMA_g6151.t1 [Chlamydomonas eustigma]|eukprot:GAX78713.1 hypothetical protein CEUSTIGMA_g6151.t1 [Chlamydomonas eustigma]